MIILLPPVDVTSGHQVWHAEMCRCEDVKEEGVAQKGTKLVDSPNQIEGRVDDIHLGLELVVAAGGLLGPGRC